MDTISGKLTQKLLSRTLRFFIDSVVIAEDGKTILEVFDDFKDPGSTYERKVLNGIQHLKDLGTEGILWLTTLKYIAYGKKR